MSTTITAVCAVLIVMGAGIASMFACRPEFAPMAFTTGSIHTPMCQVLVSPEIGNLGTGPDTKINIGGYGVNRDFGDSLFLK